MGRADEGDGLYVPGEPCGWRADKARIRDADGVTHVVIGPKATLAFGASSDDWRAAVRGLVVGQEGDRVRVAFPNGVECWVTVENPAQWDRAA